jgi:hypothetical protein
MTESHDKPNAVELARELVEWAERPHVVEIEEPDDELTAEMRVIRENTLIVCRALLARPAGRQETSDLIGRLMLYSTQPGPAGHRSAMAAAAEQLGLTLRSAERETLDMSVAARLKDAESDVLRLHGEKMKFFERTIELERQLAAPSSERFGIPAEPDFDWLRKVSALVPNLDGTDSMDQVVKAVHGAMLAVAPASAIGPTVARSLQKQGVIMPPGILARLRDNEVIRIDREFLAALLCDLWPATVATTEGRGA